VEVGKSGVGEGIKRVFDTLAAYRWASGPTGFDRLTRFGPQIPRPSRLTFQ